MERKHNYEVGRFYPSSSDDVPGEKRCYYSYNDWHKLATAYTRLTFGCERIYQYSLFGNPTGKRMFSLWRVDQKCFTNDEINELYWFFLGVQIAHDIHPSKEP